MFDKELFKILERAIQDIGKSKREKTGGERAISPALKDGVSLPK